MNINNAGQFEPPSNHLIVNDSSSSTFLPLQPINAATNVLNDAPIVATGGQLPHAIVPVQLPEQPIIDFLLNKISSADLYAKAKSMPPQFCYIAERLTSSPIGLFRTLCRERHVAFTNYVHCLQRAFGWQAPLLKFTYNGSLTHLLISEDRFDYLPGSKNDVDTFINIYYVSLKTIGLATLIPFLNFLVSKNLALYFIAQTEKFNLFLRNDIHTINYLNNWKMAQKSQSEMSQNGSAVESEITIFENLDSLWSDIENSNILESLGQISSETKLLLEAENTVSEEIKTENILTEEKILNLLGEAEELSGKKQMHKLKDLLALIPSNQNEPWKKYIRILFDGSAYNRFSCEELSRIVMGILPFNYAVTVKHGISSFVSSSFFSNFNKHFHDVEEMKCFLKHHLYLIRSKKVKNEKFVFTTGGFEISLTLAQLTAIYNHPTLMPLFTEEELNSLLQPVTIKCLKDNSKTEEGRVRYFRSLCPQMVEYLPPSMRAEVDLQCARECFFDECLIKKFENLDLFPPEQIQKFYPNFNSTKYPPPPHSVINDFLTFFNMSLSLFLDGKIKMHQLWHSWEKVKNASIPNHFDVQFELNTNGSKLSNALKNVLDIKNPDIYVRITTTSIAAELAGTFLSVKSNSRFLWLFKAIKQSLGIERYLKLINEEFTVEYHNMFQYRSLTLQKILIATNFHNEIIGNEAQRDVNSITELSSPQANPLEETPLNINRTSDRISTIEVVQGKLKILNHAADLIKEQWICNPRIRKQLFQGILNSRGTWEFDIAKLNCKPFLALILKQKNQGSQTQKSSAIEAVKTLIKFMQLYRPDNVSPPSDSNDSALIQRYFSQQLNDEELSELVHDLCPRRPSSFGDLNDLQCYESAEIFIRAKLQELFLRLKTQKFLGENQRLITIPCFILAQDTYNAHFEVLSAELEGGRSLRGIKNGRQDSEVLLTNCGIIVAEKEEGRRIAYANAEQLKALHQYAKLNPNQLILLERSAFKEMSATEESRPIENEPFQVNRQKRAAEADETSEVKDVKRKKATFDVLHADLSITPDPKREPYHAQEEKLKNPSTIHPEGKYEALHDSTAVVKPAAKKTKTTGILAISQGSVPAQANRPECTDPDDLLNFLSNEAASSVLDKVKIEEAKLRVASEQTPLQYNCMTLLTKAALTPLRPLPLLNRLLKNYQQKDLDDLNHFAKAGISKLLCYEMGVGKTFVYGSDLLVQIYNGLKGHAVVITPAAIHTAIHKDLVRVLQEGILTAWEYLQNHDDGSLLSELRKRLNSSNSDDIHTGLMMASLIDKEVFALQMKKISKSILLMSENFIVPLSDSVRSRLENLKNNYKGLPQQLGEIDKALQLLCTIKNLSPLNQLQLLGQLLYFNPGRKPVQGEYSIEGMKRLIHFSFEDFHNSQDAKNFKKQLNGQKFKIVIGTYENLLNLIDDKKEFNGEMEVVKPLLRSIQWIAFDEMQKLQNFKSKVSASVKAFVQEMTNAKKIGVTGTPLENRFEEVITLLDIVNPGQFNRESLEGLMKINQMAVEQLQAKKKEEALQACFLSYIHMTALQRGILNHLILRRTQEDQEVINDWDNRVAELIPCNGPMTLTPESNQVFDGLLENLKNKKEIINGVPKKFGILSFKKRESRLLLHPSLVYGQGSFSLENPVFQEFIARLKQINTPNDTDYQLFNNLVKNSPLLNYIWHHPKIAEIKRSNLSAIGFVSDTVPGKAVKVLLNRMGIKAKFYRATGLKEEQREKRLKWFKNPENMPKFLVLTFGSGSTGFSLPEATQVWMFDDVWNPKKESQALYRAKRIGFKTNVHVVKYHNDLFSKHHVSAVLSNKDNLFDFLFVKYGSTREHFKAWMNYLEGMIYHKYLINNKDQEAASRKLDSIQELSNEIIEYYSENDLNRGIRQVMPHASFGVSSIPVVSRSDAVAQEIFEIEELHD